MCDILVRGKRAIEALRDYASATDNEALAEAIYSLVGKAEPMQNSTDNNDGCKWISVKERLPNESDANEDLCVLALHKASKKQYYHWRTVADNSFDFVCWMTPPEPPKEDAP